MGNESSKLTSYTLLVLLIIIWGVSWPIYKNGVNYMPPLLFAGVRAFIGGGILFVIAWKFRAQLNLKTYWKYYFISAILNIVLYLGIQTIGILFLPGGLFSVIVYFQPVLLGIFAWWFLDERLTATKIIGLIIGFLGILFVSMEGITVHLSWVGVALALATAVVWALGVIYVKKNKAQVNSFWMVVMQLVIGGAILLIGGLMTEDVSTIQWNIGLISSLVWGATAGMAIAQVIYFKLMNEGEASKVGAYTFLVPILSVIVSSIFLKESITLNLFFGMILVGLSIYLVNVERKKL